jgi:hypothetical protein
VNVLAGLLYDARDGGRLHRANKGKKGGGPILVGYRAVQGVAGAKCVSFPLTPLEAAIRKRLRELDPRDLLPRDTSTDRVLSLSGRLAELEGKVEKVKAKLLGDDADLDPLVDVLRKLEADRKAAADALAAARREAASPLAAAWGEAQAMADVIDPGSEPADFRVRLRAALRRIVTGIWCLFVTRGRHRLAAVQIWFEGGGHRDYAILYDPPHGNGAASRPGLTQVLSFADVGAGNRDLRKPADVKKVEALLQAAAGELAG